MQQLQQENLTLKAEIYDLNKTAGNLNSTLSQFAQGLAEKLGLDPQSEKLLDEIYEAVEPVEKSEEKE